MARSSGRSIKSERFVYETLFAVDLGLLIVLARSWDHFPLLEKIRFVVMRTQQLDYYAAGLPAFYCLSVMIAALIFAVLRLIHRISKATLWVEGFIIIAAVPLCTFYPAFLTLLRTGYHRFGVNAAIASVEVFIVLCWICLLRRKFTFYLGVNLAVICLHYTFWILKYHQQAPYHLSALVFPIVGFLTAVAWFMYIRNVALNDLGTGRPASSQC